MPQLKIYANRAEQQRAYRARVKERVARLSNNAQTAPTEAGAAQSLQTLNGAIAGAAAANHPLAKSVYRDRAEATVAQLTKMFFRASIGDAQPEAS